MPTEMFVTKHNNVFLKDDGKTVSFNEKDFRLGKDCSSNIAHLTQFALFWNHANAIHYWFLRTLSKGQPCDGEGREFNGYGIDRRMLNSLRTACWKVLESFDLLTIRVPKKFVNKFKDVYGTQNKSHPQRIWFDIERYKMFHNMFTPFHVIPDYALDKAKKLLPIVPGSDASYNGEYLNDIIWTLIQLENLHENEQKSKRADYFTYEFNY